MSTLTVTCKWWRCGLGLSPLLVQQVILALLQLLLMFAGTVPKTSFSFKGCGRQPPWWGV